MTRIVIHIGSHKTGTTYLQRGFVALRPNLRAAGIDYPVEWQDHLYGHHSLVRQLASGDGAVAARLRALADEAARDGRTMLLSSENFEDLPEAAVLRLAAALDGHGVEIVYFLRRWQGLLPSTWQESVKQGGCETLPEFVLAHLMRLDESPLLNPAVTLGRFASAFGPASLRLVGYDRLVEQNVDLLRLFLSRILDMAIDVPVKAERVNRALPPADVEIIRVLNAAARRAPDSLPGGVWPMRLFFELGRQGLPPIGFLRRTLAAHVERLALPALPALQSIEQSVIDRFGTLWPSEPVEAAACAADHVAGTYWMEAGVPAAFAELHNEIRRSHAATAVAA